jgi:hypothetical protein|tara:strand:- start:236 stop:562 length:327 start_codon:yes stop_codon:yes gene_type:complete
VSKKIPIENTGITKTILHSDDSEGKIHIETTQDVQPVLEENKIRRNLGEFHNKKKDWYHAASIPLVVVQQLVKKGIMHPHGAVKDKARFKKWVNDPDNRAFRIWQGNV